MDQLTKENYINKAKEWLEGDPDPKNKEEIRELLREGHIEKITKVFHGRLKFGTAGLRGTLGAGPNKMNTITVKRLAYGLSKYLKPKSKVVVGYDARHKSQIFAKDICDVLNASGISTQIFPKPIPTPVLAFSVRNLKTDLGIMVTASHNPASDNGCKIFLNDGAQLRSPIDQEIDDLIELAPLLPEEVSEESLTTILDQSIWQNYCDSVASTTDRESSDIQIAYSPLHGVAWETIKSVFANAKAGHLIPVPRQMDPDPDFPTTPFPNPEEEGVMDQLIELASSCKADIAIANDPDGDRLAAAIPTSNNGWRVLSGDEIGALLFSQIVQKTNGNNRKVVSTLVSSSLVSKIALANGIRHEETLTGFKWIMQEAYKSISEIPIFCYEEALGYAVTEIVRDKDGISAALLLAEIAFDCKKEGTSLEQKLEGISAEYGHHSVKTIRVRFESNQPTAYLNAIMQGLRNKPPTELTVGKIVRVTDYMKDDIHSKLPADNLIRFETDQGVRILIRPSGTEPMIKIYMEKVTDVLNREHINNIEKQSQTLLGSLALEIEQILRSYQIV